MLARLGHVLGWTANIIAGGLFAIAVYLFEWGRTFPVPAPYVLNAYKEPYLKETAPELFCFGAALIIFLIGRALRYIFAGPTISVRLGEDGYKEFKRLE